MHSQETLDNLSKFQNDGQCLQLLNLNYVIIMANYSERHDQIEKHHDSTTN